MFWRVYSNCFALSLEKTVSSSGVSRETAVHSVREEQLLLACIVLTVWP